MATAIRVVVDLLVDEAILEEKRQEGATDKFLVGEVRRTLRLEGSRLWYDHDVQEVTIVENGGHHEQKEP